MYIYIYNIIHIIYYIIMCVYIFIIHCEIKIRIYTIYTPGKLFLRAHLKYNIVDFTFYNAINMIPPTPLQWLLP
jgi:hypothetical protein